MFSELQEDQQLLHKNLDSLRARLRTIKNEMMLFKGSFVFVDHLSTGEWHDYAIETSAQIIKNPRSIKAVLSRIGNS